MISRYPTNNRFFRTHMAEWMEWRITNKETNKLSDEVNILTREERTEDSTEENPAEKNM